MWVRLRWMKLPYVITAIGFFFLLMLYINLNELQCIGQDQSYRGPTPTYNVTNLVLPKGYTYAVYGKDVDVGHLKHVYSVLGDLGFTRVSYEENSNWDLMWAHDYPFRKLSHIMKDLKPHQKVNHFPGTGFITNKMDLATNTVDYVPKAFKLPEHKKALLDYARDYPNKKFVQKSNEHRGIRIKDIDHIDLTQGGTFVQEYVSKPLLVDGHKFDIGVYVTITSFDPLRVYSYNGDALFRYCTEKYYPFDDSRLEKYVVGDDYIPTWEMPSLKRMYTELGFSMKESFNGYLKKRGQDPNIVWSQIEDAVRRVCISKETKIMKYLSQYKSKRNFFEMMRFDFVVDENLKVFVMEVNMSPNLSSAHFLPNRLLYEQVLFNLFKLVGIRNVRSNIREYEVSDKNIMVDPVGCSKCESCMAPMCQLCNNCMTLKSKEMIKDAYLEHMEKGDNKRVFPISNVSEIFFTDELLGPENLFMKRWFDEMCKSDSSWC